MDSPSNYGNKQPEIPNQQPPGRDSPRRGRPRKLDEMQLREICALISAGCGMTGAARYVGCAASTIRREASRNKKFDDDLRRAFLAAELSPLHAMRRAAATHWRAAAWLLERTNPQRFARQHPVLLKPEQLRSFLDIIGQILCEEVTDVPMRKRTFDRLERFAKQMEIEAWAERDDPMPDPRPRPKRSARPLPQPTASPLHDDSRDLQPPQ